MLNKCGNEIDKSDNVCSNYGVEKEDIGDCSSSDSLKFPLIVIIILIIVVSLYIIYRPLFFKFQNKSPTYTACQNNCKNLGVALEMYSVDNQGRYPISMKEITPNYMKKIPRCPIAWKDTYSNTYTSTAKPSDAFTFYCDGENHKEYVNGNYPQYNSIDGLVVK